MLYFCLGEKKKQLMQIWKKLSIEELLLCETFLFSLEVREVLTCSLFDEGKLPNGNYHRSTDHQSKVTMPLTSREYNYLK